MATSLLLGACNPATDVNVKETGDKNLIGKSDIRIKDGRMTPEALWAMGRIGGMNVSPDGKRVVYTVAYYSVPENKSNREVFVMNADGSDNKQITKTGFAENEAVWIKGGTKIAFLCNESGSSQLWEMNPDGTDRKRLSDYDKDIEGFAFSPDEKKVLFISQVKTVNSTADKYPDLDKATGVIITDLMYKHWDEWVTTAPHPFVADFDGKSISNPVDVMEGELFESPMKPFGSIEQLAWNTTSDKIAYTSRKKTGKEYAISTNSDIYVYDLNTKQTTNITEENKGYDTNPTYSPDGKSIAWLSMERDGYEADQNRLMVMNLETGEKTFVSKPRYAVALCTCMDDATVEAKLAEIPKVDYDRIGERMYAELVYVNCGEGADAAKYTALVEKAAGLGRTLVLDCKDPEIAKAALAVCKDSKPVLNGADASNYEAMNAVATEAGVVLGVSGKDLNELYDTTAALEKLGNKNLVLDTTGADIKETFANTVQVRRAALKDQDRTFGYPSIVNLVKIAKGDLHLQAALASMFTMKYGSIIVMEQMTYAEALPLYGLRQNVYTDPQKPMKVEPGIYPLNGADENAVVVTTVDFALTYFVVSGELERSGVPLNLVINDAGGLSVLTSWAAGKFSGNSISSYIKENVEPKVKSRKLIIPGKVAVLKGDLEAKLPGWEIIVGPREAVQLVKFLKDLQADGQI